MKIETADVVISLNGRDEGKRFIVVGTEDEYSLLADGKGRRIEKPKRKKNKHVELEDKTNNRIAEKLLAGERVTNNEIRRVLAEYAAVNGEANARTAKVNPTGTTVSLADYNPNHETQS